MPDAMAGESVGYHSFVPRWRRNMTHRINHLALFHCGNTSFLSGDFRIKVLKRLKVFHGEMNHEAVAARANSCPSAPDSVRIQPLRRPLQRSFVFNPAAPASAASQWRNERRSEERRVGKECRSRWS